MMEADEFGIPIQRYADNLSFRRFRCRAAILAGFQFSLVSFLAIYQSNPRPFGVPVELSAFVFSVPFFFGWFGSWIATDFVPFFQLNSKEDYWKNMNSGWVRYILNWRKLERGADGIVRSRRKREKQNG